MRMVRKTNYVTERRLKMLKITGTAIFPHLNTPNTKFNPDGVYEVSVRIDAKQMTELMANIKPYMEDEFKTLCAINKIDYSKKTKVSEDTPWRKATAKDGTIIENQWDIKIKQNRLCGSGEKQWKFTPKLFNSRNEICSDVIGSGSRINVAFKPYCWYVKGQLGISLRLVAVQVIKLESYDACPFDPIEEDTPLVGEEFEKKLRDAMDNA